MKFSISLTLLATLASAQDLFDTTISNLKNIQTLTNNVTTTVQAFSGDINGALVIQNQAANLVNATDSGTSAVDAQQGTFSDDNAFYLGAYTQNLAYTVNASVAAIIAKKSDFMTLSLGSIVVQSLQQLLNSSVNFAEAITERIPEELKPIAAAISFQIAESITEGILCYNGTNSSCITAVADPTRTINQAYAADDGVKFPDLSAGSSVSVGLTTTLLLAGLVAMVLGI